MGQDLIQTKFSDDKCYDNLSEDDFDFDPIQLTEEERAELAAAVALCEKCGMYLCYNQHVFQALPHPCHLCVT